MNLPIQEILTQHGLLALYFVVFVEADLGLIVAGVVAHLGFFHLVEAVLAGAAGSLSGDMLWYLLGRSHSERLRNSRFYRKVGRVVERLARRMGPRELIASRAIYGTRIASMVFWGLHNLPVLRFLVYDGIGCFAWSLLLISLGYLLSGSAAAVLGSVRRAEVWLLVAAILAAVVLFAIHRRSEHRLEELAGEDDGGEGA